MRTYQGIPINDIAAQRIPINALLAQQLAIRRFVRSTPDVATASLARRQKNDRDSNWILKEIFALIQAKKIENFRNLMLSIYKI